MKTKILSLLVAATIIFNVSYANNTDIIVNENILASFSKQFENASDVQWTKTAVYAKASFTWNDQYLTAFYDEGGISIAIARNITRKDLPVILQTTLANEYSAYWISDLFEYTTKDNNKYYLTIESADKKIMLESVNNNYWEVFKKTIKA